MFWAVAPLSVIPLPLYNLCLQSISCLKEHMKHPVLHFLRVFVALEFSLLGVPLVFWNVLCCWPTNRTGENRTGEPVKTGQVNPDHLTGHFRGHFRGRLRGTFRELSWESLKG